ncbi:MAG: cytochrome c oxidase accessory protein CcoG [Chthoniobacterales bacterium]|nr:cytochrome c oxidase accessory protein CcoG [Chthoniobacterales bacterium]
MKPKAPTIDSVTTINEDGSRYFVHPADVGGRFTWSRRAVAVLLIAIYISLPFLKIKGEPAVFLDIFHRKLHLFGLTLMFQDLWLLFFIITGMAFGLFVVTSIAGRLWCGWACPQTVFLDHVFRRVERWIDGDASARRRLEDGLWTGGKILKRVLKHAIFILLAAAIAHMFLSYFVSIPALYGMMRHAPGESWEFFLFVSAVTGILYFNFAWFREQFCIIMCPYGRLGSVLIDDNSIVVGYDTVRGEPRGRAGTVAGDCIDCRRCVQVCPTGIDIRQGLQMECISCEACIDACDVIMDKLERPRGLIRHDSLNALAGRPSKFWRPRLFLYMILGAVGSGAFVFAAQQVKPVILSVLRMQGAPYFRDESAVRNNFMVRIANKRAEACEYSVNVDSPVSGLAATGASSHPLTLGPGEEVQEPLIMTVPDADFGGNFDVQVQVRGADGKVEAEKSVPFLGPFREGS